MSTLLVDIGNTRVKWALLRGLRLGRMQARAHGGSAATLRALVRRAPADVERVLAVSVAGGRLDRALVAAVRARFRVPVEFARSTRLAAGVRNGYRDTWRLGADRWIGVIAAHSLAGGRAALVANIGTALTLDAVAAGKHLGGAIAPGPDTMIESLLAGTHGIRRRARGTRSGKPGVGSLFAPDTARALAAGARYAAAALIDRALGEARSTLGTRPRLYLTGGGAAALKPYIKSAVIAVPDLVLRGLAVLARS